MKRRNNGDSISWPGTAACFLSLSFKFLFTLFYRYGSLLFIIIIIDFLQVQQPAPVATLKCTSRAFTSFRGWAGRELVDPVQLWRRHHLPSTPSSSSSYQSSPHVAFLGCNKMFYFLFFFLSFIHSFFFIPLSSLSFFRCICLSCAICGLLVIFWDTCVSFDWNVTLLFYNYFKYLFMYWYMYVFWYFVVKTLWYAVLHLVQTFCGVLYTAMKYSKLFK